MIFYLSYKLYKEIRELGEAQNKATDELEAILNRMDLMSANGVKTSEEDVLAMFSAMGKVDPFYSQSNMDHLRRGVVALNAGKGILCHSVYCPIKKGVKKQAVLIPACSFMLCCNVFPKTTASFSFSA